MNANADPRRPYFLKHVFLGLAIIVGFFVCWYPLWVVLLLADLFASGAKGGAVPIQDLHVFWRNALPWVGLGVTVAVSIAIWGRAAQGPSGSTLRATAYALVAAVILAVAGESARVLSWFVFIDGQDTHDLHRTSANAATRLERHPAFPFTGFWQQACGDDVGITMERETRWLNLYRLEFCGEHGCGLRNWSKIVGDPDFHVIDSNTIRFEASRMLRYPVVYHRCDPPDPARAAAVAASNARGLKCERDEVRRLQGFFRSRPPEVCRQAKVRELMHKCVTENGGVDSDATRPQPVPPECTDAIMNGPAASDDPVHHSE